MSTINTNQLFAEPAHVNSSVDRAQWNAYSRAAFRVFFIYFLSQVLPLDWKFYRDLFSINWSDLQYSDIFHIAHYTPRFSAGAQTFGDWGILFLIAVAGGLAWTYATRNKNIDYDNLYYWLRVIVRYRLAIAIIAYGLIKFFPLQSPYPSLSNLNTSYGDFTRWKLFSLSLGIVPNYESFLGAVEIVTGILLLYRRTASIGAFIILVFTGNVFISNVAYDGNEQVYSLYLITLAAFILTFDIQRLFNLLILQKPTSPNRFRPVFSKRQRWIGYSFKTSFIFFFVILYAVKINAAVAKEQLALNNNKGLSNASGIYNVSVFRINKDSIAYSKTDPQRWQDVVIEKWNTISIRSNRSVIVDSNYAEAVGPAYANKLYEVEGSAGRHYYHYEADTINHTLLLHNRNKNYAGEKLRFHYERINDSTLSLSGINEHNDAVYVLLNKINRKYLLEVVAETGRQKALKL
jgi:hypothetical protein